MKAILSVVSVAAVIALSAGAWTPDKTFLDRVNEFCKENEKQATFMICDGSTQIRIQKVEKNDFDVVQFTVTPQNSDDSSERKCSGHLGMKLPDEKLEFTSLSSLYLDDFVYTDGNSRQNEVMRMILDFKANRAAKESLEVFVILIPIPAELTSDKAALEKWVEDYQVSLDFPMDVSKLTDLENGKEVLIDMSWFDQLLKYGVSQRDEGIYTHAVAAPVEVYDKLTSVFNKFKGPSNYDGSDWKSNVSLD